MVKTLSKLKIWPISCLNNSETQERGLKEKKKKKFPRGAHLTPRTSLEACAFGTRLGNRSVLVVS